MIGKKVKYFVHLHKRFPFNFESEWVVATAYEKNLALGGDYICLSDYQPSIAQIFRSHTQDPERIGYLAQTIATEYWILHHLHDIDYVGVTGYRRYAKFAEVPTGKSQALQTCRANQLSVNLLTDNNALKAIHEALVVHDVIVPRGLYFGKSIREQFLHPDQLETVWDAFIEAVAEILPQYRRYLPWFDSHHLSHFFGPMGMTPLGMYKEYADIYIKIVDYILRNVRNPFIVIDPLAQTKTDRWVGYLAERFYAFFLHVNAVRKFEVPVVLLEEPKFRWFR